MDNNKFVVIKAFNILIAGLPVAIALHFLCDSSRMLSGMRNKKTNGELHLF